MPSQTATTWAFDTGEASFSRSIGMPASPESHAEERQERAYRAILDGVT